ncbi:MAG TPA: LysR substrate-binding domain-containing protein [Usitatibacter sp.]|nr:LysR substrate-binding domain-containing protein [Usitatibacter sp.]
MNMVQMRSFHAVATTGSFVGASRLLNISQPTITTQVKSLEETYGVELFSRQGRGVQLTEYGRTLFALTQKTMANFQETVEFLKESKGLRIGHLRLAAVGSRQVVAVLTAFNRRYPKVNITVQFGNSRAVEQAILDYEVDIGFLGKLRTQARFHRVRFSHPEILVVVNPGHPWSRRKTLRIEELANQPMVMREAGSETRRVLEQAAGKARVTLAAVMEIRSREGLLAAVEGGIGVGCVSEEELASHEVHALRVSNAEMHTYVDIACLEERKSARLHKAFFEVAAQHSKASD